MDDNDEFIIILHIEEGVGLNFKCDQVVVTASLGGNKLETEPATVAQSTLFNNNLIWETDKKSIKKMKTENLPIKVECFTSEMHNGQEVRSMIGYILVPIRGIAIVPQKKAINVKPHWHKIVGLSSEWRAQKPEILLFVTITDKTNLDADSGLLNVQNTSNEAGVESIQIEPCNTADMLTTQGDLFIKLLQDEGLLQVGNIEANCDIFIVKLMFKSARNLEHIVNPEEPMNQLFRFHYNLLGSPTHCSLVPKGNGLYSIQEKIAIHFRTTLQSLNEYFRRVLYIPIDLYYNDTIVGHARFTFANLLETDNLQDFVAMYGCNENTMESEGSFMIETLFDLPPTALKPYVEFTFGLKYLSTTKISNCEIIEDKPQVAEYIDNQAGGDVSTQHTVELPPTEDVETKYNAKDQEQEVRATRSDTELVSAREAQIRSARGKQPKITRSEPMIQLRHHKTDIDILLMEKNESRPAKNIPRTFSFNLILQTVKFTRKPEIGIWQISLHHPKSDTTFTVANVELTEINSNLIEFRDLELQLFFSSTTDEILDLIECEPCALTINGPRGVHATADLDNEILLVGTKEKRSGVILMEDQTGEKIAMAHIFVYLDDLGLSFNSQVKRLTSLTQQPRAYLDENLAYKIVEELEEWKVKQQEIFLVELKRREVNHLAHLTAEFQKRKSDQENMLAEKLEQCTMLTAALEDAHNTLKEKGVHQLEQERVISETKAELEQNYAEKLMDLREKAHCIEEDMGHQLKLQELKYRELEMTKNLIEHENEKLKNEMKELESKIAEMKQSFLPREQLAGLFQDLRILSERLDEVQKSKNFYKDQWAKIIREVHKMKSENLHQMELQLKQSRAIGLKEFLSCEHEELVSEREELDFIKDALCSDCESDAEKTMRETN